MRDKDTYRHIFQQKDSDRQTDGQVEVEAETKTETDSKKDKETEIAKYKKGTNPEQMKTEAGKWHGLHHYLPASHEACSQNPIIGKTFLAYLDLDYKRTNGEVGNNKKKDEKKNNFIISKKF